MITREQAAELLSVGQETPLSLKTLSSFENIEDPFNVSNRLSGWLCHQSDFRYGSLVIGAVNGILVTPRVIYGIPKLKYPFYIDQNTGERKYDWGIIDSVEAYAKYDGTNITAYRYFDADGKPYVTFKLRLFPFVRNNRFGDLLDLWQNCLSTCPQLFKRCEDMPDNWFPTFEMFGYRNPHMIVYDKPIDFIHLCMIGQGEHAGQIKAPYTYDFVKTNHPAKSMTSGKQLTAFYEDLRQEAHEANQGKTEYGELLCEGYVLYAKNKEGLKLFKLKPSAIEDIAWGRGVTIQPHTIETTCWNAFEHVEELTLEVVNQLLLEEFEQEALDKFQPRIEKVFRSVKHLQKLQEKALSVYGALPDSIKYGSTGDIMRNVMKEFDKKASTSVYKVLRMAGLFECKAKDI